MHLQVLLRSSEGLYIRQLVAQQEVRVEVVAALNQLRELESSVFAQWLADKSAKFFESLSWSVAYLAVFGHAELERWLGDQASIDWLAAARVASERGEPLGAGQDDLHPTESVPLPAWIRGSARGSLGLREGTRR